METFGIWSNWNKKAFYRENLIILIFELSSQELRILGYYARYKQQFLEMENKAEDQRKSLTVNIVLYWIIKQR